MDRLNILFLTKSMYDMYGFSRPFNLAKGLVELGHQVTFICAVSESSRHHEIRDGVEIIAFADFLPYQVKKGGLSPIDMISRLLYLHNKEFDLVHVETGYRPVTGLVGHLYAWWKKVPYVCEWWDWIGKGGLYDRKSATYRRTLGVLDNYFEEWDKKHADGVVPLSAVLKRRAIGLGIEEKRLQIIHGGADQLIIQNYDKYACRKKFGFREDAFLACYAGVGSHEAYDLEPFLLASKSLKQRHSNYGWFGTGGRLREDVRVKYGVSDEYIEGGWVDNDDYGAYLACADVFILTLQNDLFNQARWPNKLGDYLAIGRPVIATAVGEVIGFSEKYPDVLTITEWGQESVATAIESWIERPDELEALRQRQIHIARHEYSCLRSPASWNFSTKMFY